LAEGDIVVLDNLKAHKGSRVAAILAKKNCAVRYLPPGVVKVTTLAGA
jgi:hypothetical protein